mmetsp:Transcript_24681/g.72208  ORF Transcript_24681/g.72208 Transcript_24681/m.72208 type:complete len:81 (+) Transcript_24681:3464-3706(+)
MYPQCLVDTDVFNRERFTGRREHGLLKVQSTSLLVTAECKKGDKPWKIHLSSRTEEASFTYLSLDTLTGVNHQQRPFARR